MMMKVTWKVCLAAMVAAVCATNAHAQKEQVADYVQSRGHNPNLSPEQIRHLAMNDGASSANHEQAPRRAHVAGSRGTIGETAHITREHVLANVNKYGHDPSLTPEEIYERIRNEK
eukprot:scaffold41180_cov145-Amphora_coffeaeformis.AAC.1